MLQQSIEHLESPYRYNVFTLYTYIHDIYIVYSDDAACNSAESPCLHIRSLHLMQVSVDMCVNAFA